MSTTGGGSAAAVLVHQLDGTRHLDREEIGGKAFSINRMRGLGLPVPPAFALATSVCARYHDNGGELDPEVWASVCDHVRTLEEQTGRTFGGTASPLLVSVRSGAAQSMPGMMDTVLNLGINTRVRDALAEESGDPQWADDLWQRFRRQYAEIVMGDHTATPPMDPYVQLREAIGAVFASWNNERVGAYRRRHGLGLGGGTAVTVQAMVFGNRGPSSGTGVMFTRNPVDGSAVAFGEWLPRAQGDDVVSGVITPEPLSALASAQPGVHDELLRAASRIESDLADLADIEFTVEGGRLYVLQARAGKRTASAAVRVAVDLQREGVIDAATAASRVTTEHVAAILELASGPVVDENVEPIATGLGACPGTVVGIAVRDLDRAVELAANGTAVVLVRPTTAPEEVPVMFESMAVVTDLGGSTSHAALVCREIGLACVVGCGEGTADLLDGHTVTVDGASGRIFLGDLDAGGEAASRLPVEVEHLLALAVEVEGGSLPSDHHLLPLLHARATSHT